MGTPRIGSSNWYPANGMTGFDRCGVPLDPLYQPRAGNALGVSGAGVLAGERVSALSGALVDVVVVGTPSDH